MAPTQQKPQPAGPGAAQNPPGTPSPNKPPAAHALPSGQQLPSLPGGHGAPNGAKPGRICRQAHCRRRGRNRRADRPRDRFRRKTEAILQGRTAKLRLRGLVPRSRRSLNSPRCVSSKCNSSISRRRLRGRHRRSSQTTGRRHRRLRGRHRRRSQTTGRHRHRRLRGRHRRRSQTTGRHRRPTGRHRRRNRLPAATAAGLSSAASAAAAAGLSGAAPAAAAAEANLRSARLAALPLMYW